MSAKKLVAVRLAPSGLDVVKQLAAEEGINQSDMIRKLLGEAVQARLAKRRTR